jgi:hypothetical protein
MTWALVALPPPFSALVGRQNCTFLAVARVKRSVHVVYRDSKRAEDQEAGPVGAPGQWPVLQAGGGCPEGNISAPISDQRSLLSYVRNDVITLGL